MNPTAGSHGGTRTGVFVAGTDTGVGKTRVVVGLIRALRSLGCVAGGMKPVASGVIGADSSILNEDAAMIAAVCASTGVDAADMNPYCFEWPVSPHIGAERAGIRIDPERIATACDRLTQHFEYIVVEGTGGWLCPIGSEATMADVAAALGLPVVLVVGVRLGCLNHALLSAQAIEHRGMPLRGWIGSLIDPDMPVLRENLQALGQRLSAPLLGWLPYSRERDGDAAALTLAALSLIGPHAPATSLTR
jgi:dethiobiotin synthetase